MPTPDIDLFMPPHGADPSGVLATHGADHLAAALTDPDRHTTLLGVLVDQHLDRYDWSDDGPALRELPIATHAAYETTRLLADAWRDDDTTDPADIAQIQQQLAHIAERTGVDHRELNEHLIEVMIPPVHDEYGDVSLSGVLIGTAEHNNEHADLRIDSEVESTHAVGDDHNMS